MKLEITKEKVLEAASKCSTAKETLKELFPEVFQRPVNVSDWGLFKDEGDEGWDIRNSSGDWTICERLCGKYKNRAIRLNTADYNWEVTEEAGDTILIPTKK